MAHDRNMPPGDDCGGRDLRNARTEGGFGASAADLARGYKALDGDAPPKTLTYRGMMDGESMTMPNPERMTYDAESGEMVDKYRGGFLPRDPHNPDER
jgi:hypothetical protein